MKEGHPALFLVFHSPRSPLVANKWYNNNIANDTNSFFKRNEKIFDSRRDRQT